MLNNLLLNGGKVLIVGGFAKSWESFRKYEQLEFWSGDQKDILRTIKNREIPANCKAVVISRFISHAELSKIMSQARKRGVTLFPNKNDGEIANILDEMTMHLKAGATLTVTPPSPNPVDSVDTRQIQEPTVKKTGGTNPSKLHVLTPFVDYTLSDIDNARVLFKKAQELGVTTTLLSLSQFVRVLRRKTGAPPSPASRNTHPERVTRDARPKAEPVSVPKVVESKLDLSVEIFDNLIKDLQDMRTFLIQVTDENATLKMKMAKLKEAFE